MEYRKEIILRDGRTCVLRGATEKDAQGVMDNFLLTHGQTDYLATYPEEMPLTLEGETEFLRERAASEDEIEIAAELDGQIVGTAGIHSLGRREKTRHRAGFGVSVDRACWGLGIGRALTEACIDCAKAAGYLQLELEAVAENERALSLYRGVGYIEYGRNPKGFRSRRGWQELVLMRLDLEERQARKS